MSGVFERRLTVRREGDMSGTLITIVAGTAIGLAMAVISQAMGSPDGMLYTAILAGSVGGALCSLAIKQPKTPRELILIVVPNAVFGLTFGGLAFDMSCVRLGIPSTFQAAVAVSGAMSGFISLAVWVVAPQLLAWAYGADWKQIIAERLGIARKPQEPEKTTTET